MWYKEAVTGYELMTFGLQLETIGLAE